MNKPKIFIVGAAKAGTTSLHKYLDQHPQIFMSTPKEPKFLSSIDLKIAYSGLGDNVVYNNIIKTEIEYERLFENTINAKYTGESSADSLYYYENVIPQIKKISGDPYIIILLRNPVDRAFSAYTHLRRDQREKLSFNDGLDKENTRIEEGYEFIWHYKSAGKYYEQVKAYIDNFTTCKIILFEDLQNNIQNVLNDILADLDLPPININKSGMHNISGIPKDNLRMKLYNKFIKQDNFVKQTLELLIAKTYYDQIKSKAKKELFDKSLEKPILDEKLKQELIQFFKDDIEKLEKLINRDLKHWLK